MSGRDHHYKFDACHTVGYGVDPHETSPSQARRRRRRDGRAWAATVLDSAATRLGWSTADIGRALGVTKQQADRIRHGVRPLCVGDLIHLGSLGRAVAEAVLAESAPLVGEREQLVAEVRHAMAIYCAADARASTPSSPDRFSPLARVLELGRAMLRLVRRES